MDVICNGERRSLPDGADVAALVAELTDDPRGLAVALDGEVVPRSAWTDTPLRPGARVEVVGASQGG